MSVCLSGMLSSNIFYFNLGITEYRIKAARQTPSTVRSGGASVFIEESQAARKPFPA